MRMLDLFCGRWGWSKAFAARGWECVGIDLIVPPEIPQGCTFLQSDVLEFDADYLCDFDFVCASSPCEQFSVHGMKHFHPNPQYPAAGIRLFEHTRQVCEESGIHYVMENVRAAQQFVGTAAHHCGPFYLWGNAVPPLLNQGIIKGVRIGTGSQVRQIRQLSREQITLWRKQFDALQASGRSKKRAAFTAKWASIPPELANCVADYAERILELNQEKVMVQQ